MLNKTRAIALALFGLTAAVPAVHAASITTITTVAEGEHIRFARLDGTIRTGDTDKLEALIEKWEETKTPVEAVILNSKGGDVDESFELVDLILDYELSTVVLPKESCLSACVGVYAAGIDRILYPDSVVGVHRVHTRKGETATARAATLELMELYDDLEVPESIQIKMLETPPEKMYYLNVKEKMLFSTERSQFQAAAPAPLTDEEKYAVYHGGKKADYTIKMDAGLAAYKERMQKENGFSDSPSPRVEEKSNATGMLPDASSGVLGNKSTKKVILY